MAVRRRPRSEVSLILKYLLFFFNFIMWLASCVLIAVGVYAYTEKDQYRTESMSDSLDIYNIVSDLALIFAIVGAILFIISFLGCIGALRENTLFLNIFTVIIGIVFLVIVTGAVLTYVFKEQIVEEVKKVLKVEAVVGYRDDPDFYDLVNWAQEEFKCCGITEDGFRDWDKNAYFNCSDSNPSPERCGVPYSCCRKRDDIVDGVTNTMCGYGMQDKTESAAAEHIYTIGCIEGVIDWTERNLYPVIGVIGGIAFLMLLGMMLARLLVNQINITKQMAA